MTYKNIQDRVLGRHNLTSTEARTRVKEFINERYRRVRSSAWLGKTRRGSTTISVVAVTQSYALASVAKVFTIYDVTHKKLLRERTMDWIRQQDPGLASTTTAPDFYAIEKQGATSVTVFLWPQPSATETLTVDILSLETDLSADADVPGFPEDYHDVLIFGALADEYQHKEKPALEIKEERKFEKRLSELRYFIAKSRYLHRHQGVSDEQFSSFGPNYEAD